MPDIAGAARAGVIGWVCGRMVVIGAAVAAPIGSVIGRGGPAWPGGPPGPAAAPGGP